MTSIDNYSQSEYHETVSIRAPFYVAACRSHGPQGVEPACGAFGANQNAMTRLSWGPVREYVAKTDLIGRTLALYRDRADPTRFVLEID
jgi:hypothetical protein